MSLDVYLSVNLCKHCGRDDLVYESNITHNLTEMASALGIYECLWRPDENGYTVAKQLIQPLERAVAAMKENPEQYKKYNASNGWGTFDSFLPWVEKYLAACKENQDAVIRVCR